MSTHANQIDTRLELACEIHQTISQASRLGVIFCLVLLTDIVLVNISQSINPTYLTFPREAILTGLHIAVLASCVMLGASFEKLIRLYQHRPNP